MLYAVYRWLLVYLLPESVGSDGVSDLIPCKPLLKISVKYPSFLPRVLLSVLFNKYKAEALC